MNIDKLKIKANKYIEEHTPVDTTNYYGHLSNESLEIMIEVMEDPQHENLLKEVGIYSVLDLSDEKIKRLVKPSYMAI